MAKKESKGRVVTFVVTPTLEAPERITFRVAGAGETTLDLTKVSAANRTRAMVHGFGQRCVDGSAKDRDTTNGAPASPASKLAGIARIVEHYNSGADAWSLRAERVTSGAQDAADVILALTRTKRRTGEMFARDVDEANEIVRKWAEAKGVDRDAAIKAWLTSRQIAETVADIRAAREREKAARLDDLDPEAMLEEAMGVEEDEPEVAPEDEALEAA